MRTETGSKPFHSRSTRFSVPDAGAGNKPFIFIGSVCVLIKEIITKLKPCKNRSENEMQLRKWVFRCLFKKPTESTEPRWISRGSRASGLQRNNSVSLTFQRGFRDRHQSILKSWWGQMYEGVQNLKSPNQNLELGSILNRASAEMSRGETWVSTVWTIQLFLLRPVTKVTAGLLLLKRSISSWPWPVTSGSTRWMYERFMFSWRVESNQTFLKMHLCCAYNL